MSSERTDWDDAVDEAIEQLIEDDIQAFSLVTADERDVHVTRSVQSEEAMDHILLSIYALVEEVRVMSEEAGKPMPPDAILGAAWYAADERGLTRGGFETRE